MTANKQIRQTAKALLQMSLEGEEVSSERVGAVLAALESRPPRNYRAVLRDYLALVRKHLARNQAKVEHAGTFPDDLLASIEATLSAQYGRPVTAVAVPNQDLIAGWRIRIGSDVYDSSIKNHLNQMARATTAL